LGPRFMPRAGFRYLTASIFLGLGIRIALPETR
jgi:hypothetical protein